MRLHQFRYGRIIGRIFDWTVISLLLETGHTHLSVLTRFGGRDGNRWRSLDLGDRRSNGDWMVVWKCHALLLDQADRLTYGSGATLTQFTVPTQVVPRAAAVGGRQEVQLKRQGVTEVTGLTAAGGGGSDRLWAGCDEGVVLLVDMGRGEVVRKVTLSGTDDDIHWLGELPCGAVVWTDRKLGLSTSLGAFLPLPAGVRHQLLGDCAGGIDRVVLLGGDAYFIRDGAKEVARIPESDIRQALRMEGAGPRRGLL